MVNQYHKKTSGNHQKLVKAGNYHAVTGNLSVVSNGFLAGNNIEELIEVYMGDITGDAVFEKFGNEFPLLIKLIEAGEDLSIQVHPEMKWQRKNIMLMEKQRCGIFLKVKKDAKIFTGFNKGVTKASYQKALKQGPLPILMNVESAIAGDVFFTPAGRIHAIGAGTVLVEIQQTSDMTYRIFDWNRKSTRGISRELHTGSCTGSN